MSAAWLDFNDADDMDDHDVPSLDFEAIKNGLLQRLPEALQYLFPRGVVEHEVFKIGSVNGETGKSLQVALSGDKAGLWKDWESNDKGDILDLWAYVEGLDCRQHFPELLSIVNRWLGNAPALGNMRMPTTRAKNTAVYEDLGKATGKWDYHDPQGRLIACVYRYDTAQGKTFRVWDVVTRRHRAPNPRPIYQQPNVLANQKIILVEGEKCADALIAQGLAATTAMGGANAPIEKTDWSPLAGKDIIVWPDHDEAGREYAERVSESLAEVGVRSIEILSVPSEMPVKWDAHDAVAEGRDIAAFIDTCKRFIQPVQAPLRYYTLDELRADTSPIPDDLIEPRVLTPGGMLVLGGAAKVGKSDFILSWLTSLAAGESFLGMRPNKRLRIFYLQAEVQYHYLRERVQNLKVAEQAFRRAGQNLMITPQSNLVLNDEGMATAKALLRHASLTQPLDIIVIDPLRNVFDGGDDDASENDNRAMLHFLRHRISHLRDAINPEAGVIIVHHTKKLTKRQVMEDPFLSFSGASALRGYYTTGMLLYYRDESSSVRALTFELRNGAPIEDKYVDKAEGQWTEVHRDYERLVNQRHAERLDAERRRKRDVILQLIYDEAEQGRFYTSNQFAEKFEGKAGLGAHRTISEYISVRATKGEVKFFRNPEDYGYAKSSWTKFGFMCVEGMQMPLRIHEGNADNHVNAERVTVTPTHYKCPQTGASLPVENPDVWVYQEEI